ncbi:MAG TPA: neutral zinc metallopeptidase [Candidatus Binatus sp.]|jgi:predicted metalloprotease|nr:neutral zinc metallopeptidase [Candidatus Binatus sp.]
MRWTPGGISNDVEDDRSSSGGGGFPGGIHIGIGGILILLVLSFIFKRDLLTPFLGGSSTTESTQSAPATPQQSAAEQREVQFVSFVLDDVQNTWTKIVPNYRHAKLVLYRGGIDSACGLAQTATGPFYCPGDEKVYLDLGFFNELENQLGAGGEFAQAYVIAHEIGHHVQKIVGTENKVRQELEEHPKMANAISVRVELQADCYAGIWANSTEQRDLLEKGDVESAVNAAAAVGDDHLQKMETGRVMPDKFTHGTSAQRTYWFKQGLTTGSLTACDTFSSSP